MAPPLRTVGGAPRAIGRALAQQIGFILYRQGAATVAISPPFVRITQSAYEGGGGARVSTSIVEPAWVLGPPILPFNLILTRPPND
jgi:hypothetical protein